MGVQIWHLPPAEDSHFRYCRCWERSDENARDKYLQPKYNHKKTHNNHILCIEEKWVKEAWSDWNRRFENRQSSVKWAVTKLNNAAHPFLRITPCYTPLVTAPSLKLFYAASSNWQLHCIYPARLNAPLRVIFQAILLKVRFWPVCAQDPCSRWVALHTSEHCGRRRWCKCYPGLIT